jgi:hypothetical protein
MRWAPRPLLMISSAAGRGKCADGAVTKFAGAEVERKQAVRGGVGEENFFSHGRESAAYRRDETGFTDSAREREDCKDRGASLFLTDGCSLGLIMSGLLEDAFERVPAGGDALPGVLEGVGYGGLRGWRLRGERLWSDGLSGGSVEPGGAGRIGLEGRSCGG